MTLANRLRGKLHRIRTIPGRLGLRPYAVKIVTKTSTGLSLEDTSLTTEVDITEANGYPPKVRQLSNEERTQWDMSRGGYAIGPITPGDGVVGTLLSSLMREECDREKVWVVLTGPAWPDGARFNIINTKHDRALHYMLTVESERD